MIYYQGYTVSFQEVPDEVSLVILIGDCPFRCPGCHSPELQRPEGKDLTQDIQRLIDEYGDAITCVCFMGEGQDPQALCRCAEYAVRRGYRTALYTGKDRHEAMKYRQWFHYIKCGSYVEALGGLDSPTTNQRFYAIGNYTEVDMTWRFRKDFTQ